MQLLQVGALHIVAVMSDGSLPNTALACMLLTAAPAYQAENSDAKAARPDVPKVFVFNTFFWTRLTCFGKDFDYAGSAAWCGDSCCLNSVLQQTVTICVCLLYRSSKLDQES